MLTLPHFTGSLPITFTEDEVRLFELRLENGYDLKHDQRYNKWLELHHPDKLDPAESGNFKSLCFYHICHTLPQSFVEVKYGGIPQC